MVTPSGGDNIVFYENDKGSLRPAGVPNKQIIGMYALPRFSANTGFDHVKDKGVADLIVYYVSDGATLHPETVMNHQFKAHLALSTFNEAHLEEANKLKSKKAHYFPSSHPDHHASEEVGEGTAI